MTFSRRRRLGVLAALLVAGLAVVLWLRPASGPAHPYDHDDLGEASEATTTVVAGQVRDVARGLEELGYWCIQPRRNDETVQVRCQASTYGTTLDLVATTNGDLAYAHLDLAPSPDAPATPSSAVSAEDAEMWAVLDASLLRSWPDDRDTVEGLLADARPRDFMRFGAQPPPAGADYSQHEDRTSSASWSLWAAPTGSALALTVRTKHLQDRTWPDGTEHYATTLEEAMTGLVAQGFTCGEINCFRDDDTDGQMDTTFEVHDGQVVSTTVLMRTGQQDGRTVPDLAGQWLAQGLPFLTPGVQDAVASRIQRSRVAFEDWRGVVAGVPLDITVFGGRTPTPDGDRDFEVTAVIGTPLIDPFDPDR